MPYRFVEDVAIADVALEAEAATERELFQAAAAAVTNTMISDLGTIGQAVIRLFDLEASGVEMFLYRFLQELIFYKDAERLVFRRYELDIDRGILAWRIYVRVFGEEIDPEKHELLADIKAVSLHNFSVWRTAGGWKESVIIDV